MKLAAVLILPALLVAAGRPEIPLWPHGAPGSEGQTSKEVVEPPAAGRDFIRVTNVHNPTLTVYLPAPGTANGAAIIVAPGGGNSILAMHEGYDIAEWLSSKGVAAFVLKYRLAKEKNSPYNLDVHPAMDGQRAVRLVRSRAAEWGVDPARIGIMGFSAGGGLAYRASQAAGPGKADAADPVERQNSRPDFLALIYPGITGLPLDIAANAPPAFMVCAWDDRVCNESLPKAFAAFQAAKVPAEMHMYARGGHGYGIRNRPMPVSQWPVRFEEWLADQGWLKRK